MNEKVCVIGAGIVGISSAYALAIAGYDVTVFEAESYPAMKTSFANGGQISVSNSEVWNSWSNVYKGMKWLFKKDAPLLIRPSLDWDKALWLAKFLYHTANNDKAKNTAQTIQMGIRARQLYENIVKKEKISFDKNDCGILHFYKNEEYFRNAMSMQEIYESNGCEWQILDANKVFEIEPKLKSNDIIGGVWTPSDWTGDIHKYCYEMYRVLADRYNVKFLFDYRVDDVVELKSNYSKIIICNGVDATRITKKIDDKQLVYPVKGYSITIDCDSKYLPNVSLLDDQAKIVTATFKDRLRVAGTAEITGHNYDIRRDRIEPLLNWVKTNFPEIDRRKYTQWACLRPMTPNMMPITCKSKMKGVYYHFGHGHLGWTLAPATSEKLVKLITED